MVLQQKLDFSTMFMPAIQNQEFYDLAQIIWVFLRGNR